MKSSQVEIIEPPIFAATVADELVASVQEAIDERGTCSIALAGGSTPGAIYRSLSVPPRDSEIDWTKVKCFFGDERFVPADDQKSNYRMFQETLLANLSHAKPQVFPVQTQLASPQAAATAYAATLRKELTVGTSGLPACDIVLLGLGNDGHFASIFPGHEILTHGLFGSTLEDPLCVPAKNPEDNTERVSLTPQILLQSRKVFFIVSGASKADIIERVFLEQDSIQQLPALLAKQAETELRWFLDSAAAKKIRDLLE